MTDKELQDFIDHGVNGFKEFSLLFGGTWASQAVVIAKEYQAMLAQPEPEYKECRHCGFDCRHNNNQSKKWYPLEQPEKTVNGWPLFSGLPPPEPVAWINKQELSYVLATKQNGGKDWKTNLGLVPEEGDVPLYTLEQVKDVAQKLADCALMSSPPKPTKLITVGNVLEQAGYVKKKEWVSLTAADLMELVAFTHMTMENALSVEAKLKDKNT